MTLLLEEKHKSILQKIKYEVILKILLESILTVNQFTITNTLKLK